MEYLIRDINGIDSGKYAEISALLPAETAERIKRLKPDDRKRTLAGRILLFDLIFKLYGKTEFNVKIGKNGKPELDFCYFNISHSGDYAVCAVSDVPVGIDIERISGFKKRERYMLFSPEESEFVNECESEKRFFTL